MRSLDARVAQVIRIDAVWLAAQPIDMRTGVDRLLARHNWQGLDLRLAPENCQLLLCGRAGDVEGGHQHPLAPDPHADLGAPAKPSALHARLYFLQLLQGRFQQRLALRSG